MEKGLKQMGKKRSKRRNERIGEKRDVAEIVQGRAREQRPHNAKEDEHLRTHR